MRNFCPRSEVELSNLGGECYNSARLEDLDHEERRGDPMQLAAIEDPETWVSAIRTLGFPVFVASAMLGVLLFVVWLLLHPDKGLIARDWRERRAKDLEHDAQMVANNLEMASTLKTIRDSMKGHGDGLKTIEERIGGCEADWCEAAREACDIAEKVGSHFDIDIRNEIASMRAKFSRKAS